MIAATVLLAAAGATALAIPFAPPDGRPLRLVIVQTRDGSGGPMRFRLSYTIRFARDGDGWTMAATLDDLSADAPPRSAEVFEAGKRPFVGEPMTVRLDRAGRILSVDDETTHWARYHAGQGAIAAVVARATGLSATDRQAITGVVAGLLGATPDVRRRHLLADVEPVVAQAGRTVDRGTPIAFAGVSGGATGTLTLERQAGDVAHFTLRSRTAPGALADVRDDREIDVDLATGLTRREVRTRLIRQDEVDSRATEERMLSGIG